MSMEEKILVKVQLEVGIADFVVVAEKEWNTKKHSMLPQVGDYFGVGKYFEDWEGLCCEWELENKVYYKVVERIIDVNENNNGYYSKGNTLNNEYKSSFTKTKQIRAIARRQTETEGGVYEMDIYIRHHRNTNRRVLWK